MGDGNNFGYIIASQGSLDNNFLKSAILGSRIDYHSITERIGIHYYLGRHQFEVLLSLEPVVGGKDSILCLIPVVTAYSGAGTVGYKLFYTNSFYYNFSLNYTYRF